MMANEVRLIDANALPYENQVLSYDDEWCLKVSDIEKVPTIDPESLRPKGRWVDHMVRDWRCSECGEKIHKVRNVDGYCYDDKPNYCPNCGEIGRAHV